MIIEKIKELLEITDLEWGRYTFSSDPLNRRIKEAQRDEIILKANECGRQEAKKLVDKYGVQPIWQYVRIFKVNIIREDSYGSSNYIMFAKFNYPDNITVFMRNVMQVLTFIREQNLKSILKNVDVESLLIAHELFHYCEAHNPDVYTKTLKIEIWRFGPFHCKSGLVAPGEIAAMAFARELLGLSYNPNIFNVLMLYPHDALKTAILLDNIKKFKKVATQECLK